VLFLLRDFIAASNPGHPFMQSLSFPDAVHASGGSNPRWITIKKTYLWVCLFLCLSIGLRTPDTLYAILVLSGRGTRVRGFESPIRLPSPQGLRLTIPRTPFI